MAPSGRELAEGLNHTSRSFSGPVLQSDKGSIYSLQEQLTFKGVGRVEVDGDIAVDSQVGGGRRGRDGVVIRDIDVDHDFFSGEAGLRQQQAGIIRCLEGTLWWPGREGDERRLLPRNFGRL